MTTYTTHDMQDDVSLALQLCRALGNTGIRAQRIGCYVIRLRALALSVNPASGVLHADVQGRASHLSNLIHIELDRGI